MCCDYRNKNGPLEAQTVLFGRGRRIRRQGLVDRNVTLRRILRFQKPTLSPVLLSPPIDQNVALSYCPSAYLRATMLSAMIIMGLTSGTAFN